MNQFRIAVAAFGACMLLLTAASVQLPPADFAEYWAAGRLNAAGHNPYDAAAMLRVQRQAGWPETQPVMMYNPPWMLTFAMPLGLVDIQLARQVWFIAQILICLWCTARLWELHGGSPRHVVRVWCLALLWMPTLSTVRMGQSSPLILLGLVGFMWSLRKGRETVAGLFFALTAAKPQLVALVWVAWLLWIVYERRWKVAAGTAVGLALASLVPVLTNPAVFGQYRHLMATAPPMLEFESPNVATLMRVFMTAALGTGSWMQFVPTMLGAAFVLWQWRKRDQSWQWVEQLPWLVLLSCLTTSYGGWTFDLLILLVPVIATAAVVVRADHRAVLTVAAALFVAVSVVSFAMFLVTRPPEALYLWITPVVALCSLSLERFARSVKTAELSAI